MKTNGTLQELKEYASARRKRKKWLTAVTCLAGIVVFCTVYALILPAIALERDAQCGLEEHQHTDDCYESTYVYPQTVMKCSLESLGIHTHTEECRNEEETLVCGYADFVIHTHDLYCYSEDGTLICTLPEIEAHTHGNECYDENGTLICGKTEIIAHTHTADCRDAEGNLICGQTEIQAHQHTGDCIQDPEGEAQEVRTLICGLDEHTHTDACRMTEEEAAQVNEIIARIDELPDLEEVYALLTAYNEAENREDYDADLTEIQKQVSEVYAIYAALTDTQQAQVTNIDKLLELVEGLGLNDAVETANEDTGIPEEVLTELADELKIYPGKKTTDENGNEVWTAIDGSDEESANVKATVTLPSEITSGEGYYLYIRAVTEKDPYYPSADTIETEIGSYNDMQCYAIHWVHISQDENGNWKYEYETDSVLKEENNYAKISIQYLKENAYLKGAKANRKLLVYNSRNEEGNILEGTHSTLTDVSASDTAYTGFTFETNRGGPYVFISQYVYEGYVDALKVTSIIDGTDPFDSNNEAGNDSGANNKIVRSYDVIQYEMSVTFGGRSNTVTAEKAKLYFEMTMDADVTEASFDMGEMLWLGTNYTIQYLDKDNNVVLTQDASGTYYDANGNATKLNMIISDSTNGSDSYATSVVTQKLAGYVVLSVSDSNDDTNLLAGTKKLSAAVQVLNADNGKTIAPDFKAWLDGNENNYGSESNSDGTVHLSQPDEDNNTTADTVTVSTVAKYNIFLKQNTSVNYKSWFDFSTGGEIKSNTVTEYTVNGKQITGSLIYTLLEALGSLEENWGEDDPGEYTDKGNTVAFPAGTSLSDYKNIFANIRYGRMKGYGITLQIYNTAENSKNVAAKKLKGLSLPIGEIDFDLVLTLNATDVTGTAIENGYTTILWEYNRNVRITSNYNNKTVDNHTISIPALTSGWGRTMYWDSNGESIYASGAAPWNYSFESTGSYKGFVYWGGNWSISKSTNGDKTETDKVMPDFVTGDGSSTTYSFAVSDYDFDFSNLAGMNFPVTYSNSSGSQTGWNINIGSFSGGYIQVLTVFPRTQKETVNMSLRVETKNLSVTSSSGATGSDVYPSDDYVKTGIVLYSPGNLFKSSTFNELGAKAYNIKFLGTDANSMDYSANAYAGSKVAIIGGLYVYSGDYRIRAANLLQLFDSRAFSIDTENTTYTSKGGPYSAMNLAAGDKRGNTTILYAADPKHPEGYDTNKDGILRYMNEVREENLIYSDNVITEKDEDGNITAQYILYDTDGDGVKEKLTCIGVLMELRDCDLTCERYQYVCIPVIVNSTDEGLVNKTAATVNSFRFWSSVGDMSGISWANGNWNNTNKKNTVNGYITPTGRADDGGYSVEYANASPLINGYYTKTEYNNGQFVSGTNNGGRKYGGSLLILNYKAKVNIQVDNPSSWGTYPTYDIDKGAYTVNYHLSNMMTVTESTSNEIKSSTKTSLTVKAKLDEKYTGDEQRISVSANTYKIVSSDAISLLDENNNKIESIDISSNSEEPTKVRYQFGSDIYEIDVYAERDNDRSGVTFHLSNVTVGVSIPDITFEAVIDQTTVKNNNTIKTSAYISGSGDARAYSEVNGNMDSVTIGVTMLYSTRLVKSVDVNYIELDGMFTYTVTYTNSGTNVLNAFYLNDLLPDAEDTRSSSYTGDLILKTIDAELVTSTGNSIENSGSEIVFYYSTMEYEELRRLVDLTNEENRDVDKIERMLNNTDYYNILGRIDDSNNHQFVWGDTLSSLTDDEREERLKEVTGIYIVVKNLDANTSISIKLTVKSSENIAGDVYKNVAYTWLGDDSEPLMSNMVETVVLSRAISGVVWYDSDLDGVRDDNEALLNGVTAALFKLDENNGSTTYGKYVPCTAGVTDKGICTGIGHDGQRAYTQDGTTVTDSDGTYYFGDLSAGNYIVAFSKDDLKQYTGAAIYQVNKENDDNTNDGVPLLTTSGSLDTEGITFDGIDSSEYAYAIAYSLSGKNPEAVSVHSIEEITAPNSGIVLNNYVELYANQDLGLVIAGFELPKTGGTGTILFTIGGLLLMAGAVGCGYGLRRRRERRANG